MKFGKAFVDSILIARKHKGTRPVLRGWGARHTLMYILTIAAFFTLWVRLFHLTVVRGEENRGLSEENRVREVVIHAERGKFFDRRGVPLVANTPAYRQLPDCSQSSPCQPTYVSAVKENVALAAHNVSLEKDFIREYLYPKELAHVLGYLGELTPEEMQNPAYLYRDYLAGDRIGRLGLESVLEGVVRGQDGKELIEVDSNNKKLRSLGKIEPDAGRDVELTVDVALQKAAFAAMGEHKGAVVVSKPKTGEILALVSTPSFDPNRIHAGLTDREFSDLFVSNELPLFNRAISGVYPPGSTFKIITAVAGFESGRVKRDTVIEDTGVVTIGEFRFANWYFSQYGQTDGKVDTVKGIARSNDVFFYKIGEMTGVEQIARWGKVFGVGVKSGVELPAEAEGVMPDPTWRKKVKGQEWFLGDTYHLAIGQGELATTPLQVNIWTNVVASGGVWCKPTLLKALRGSGNRPMTDSWQLPFIGIDCRDLKISKQTIETVAEGMKRACFPDGGWGYQGTGWPLFDFSILKEQLSEAYGEGKKYRVPVACKTGTAEYGDPDGKTHAWFTAFAPLPAAAPAPDGDAHETTITGEPEIVVTVLVEAGGEGSSVAAPIAKQILEEWFNR